MLCARTLIRNRTTASRQKRIREAYRLRYEGLRVGEIAKRLGMSRWTIQDYFRSKTPFEYRDVSIEEENRRRATEASDEIIRIFLDGVEAEVIAARLRVPYQLVKICIEQYRYVLGQEPKLLVRLEEMEALIGQLRHEVEEQSWKIAELRSRTTGDVHMPQLRINPEIASAIMRAKRKYCK